MDPIARKSRIFGVLLLAAMSGLAGCAGFPGLGDKKPTVTIVRPPPQLKEVPVAAVIVDAPLVTLPESPQIASLPPANRRPPDQMRRQPPSPAALVGSDFASVLRVLKKPDAVQTNTIFVVWTYSRPACTLSLYFYPEIQTRVFRVLKHDLKNLTGMKLVSAEDCMRDMMVARNDDAPGA